MSAGDPLLIQPIKLKGVETQMHYVIHSMGLPFGPRTVYEKSLGGSESAAFYLARELGRRGHRVSLWTSREADQETVDNVTYLWHGNVTQETPLGHAFEFYARHTPHDVLVIQRHPAAFHKRFAAKVCIWQLHDLALKRSQPAAFSGLWQVDAVTGVSQWHIDQVKETWGLSDKVLRVVPNGVDPDLYATSIEKPFVRSGANDEVGRDDKGVILPAGKFVLLYQSRPERGFEHLVRPGGIMDRVKHLPVHLVACAYDHVHPSMKPMYDSLAKQASELPNVSMVGALTKPQLAELQRKSDLLIYPTEFNEVSCITAMEAMHAALPMLTSVVGALPETCKDSGTSLLPLKDDKCDEDAFVTWLESTFSDHKVYPLVLKTMREQQLESSKTKTWSDAIVHLEAFVEKILLDRVTNNAAGRVLRTAIERSDILFAKWYAKFIKEDDGDIDPIIATSLDELARLYQFSTSDADYKAHYEKHQGAYYDTHEDLVIGEDVTHSTRFRGTRQYLAEALQAITHRQQPMVLDYGCAHGHYLVPLAKTFPAVDFHGVDVSERAIQAATKWIERDKVENAKVKLGSGEYIETTDKRFDVIIAGEVLEHVADPINLLGQFARILNPGGAIVVTTPFGRWEHSGTVAFRTGREHMHHFDREDIEEMCTRHLLEVVCAPATHDRSDEAMGSWVWKVRPTSDQFFWPNYERKAKTYAPRETISACLIVKDGEQTLRKCVESFVDWVDEVRIFIDPKTKDRTGEVANDLKSDFPNRAFHIQVGTKSAMTDGFDAARNESMEGAAGDWIMWCDADEELHNPWQLHKLCRPSMHDGYGSAQVHYAIDPPSVLTTDYPCRLFRNRMGIKFYGLVHEHPELEVGKAIPTSIVRPELSFLHSGYVDENVRRARYQRNLPLLRRDIKAYPDRKLNKFLWLRDLAQGMMFEQEQLGGGTTQEHIDLAKEGIKLFESMIEGSPPRMLSDAMPYYSHCVATVGDGFDSKVDIMVDSPNAPGLGVKMSLVGRFHTRNFFKRVVAHFLEESTKTYEDKYL